MSDDFEPLPEIAPPPKLPRRPVAAWKRVEAEERAARSAGPSPDVAPVPPAPALVDCERCGQVCEEGADLAAHVCPGRDLQPTRTETVPASALRAQDELVTRAGLLQLKSVIVTDNPVWILSHRRWWFCRPHTRFVRVVRPSARIDTRPDLRRETSSDGDRGA